MAHDRHYTLEEAAALLPQVEELIRRLRAARERLTDREAREALSSAAPTNGGGEPGRSVSEGFLELRDTLLGLRELEVVLLFGARTPVELIYGEDFYAFAAAHQRHERRRAEISRLARFAREFR